MGKRRKTEENGENQEKKNIEKHGKPAENIEKHRKTGKNVQKH